MSGKRKAKQPKTVEIYNEAGCGVCGTHNSISFRNDPHTGCLMCNICRCRAYRRRVRQAAEAALAAADAELAAPEGAAQQAEPPQHEWLLPPPPGGPAARGGAGGTQGAAAPLKRQSTGAFARLQQVLHASCGPAADQPARPATGGLADQPPPPPQQQQQAPAGQVPPLPQEQAQQRQQQHRHQAPADQEPPAPPQEWKQQQRRQQQDARLLQSSSSRQQAQKQPGVQPAQAGAHQLGAGRPARWQPFEPPEPQVQGAAAALQQASQSGVPGLAPKLLQEPLLALQPQWVQEAQQLAQLQRLVLHEGCNSPVSLTALLHCAWRAQQGTPGGCTHRRVLGVLPRLTLHLLGDPPGVHHPVSCLLEAVLLPTGGGAAAAMAAAAAAPWRVRTTVFGAAGAVVCWDEGAPNLPAALALVSTAAGAPIWRSRLSPCGFALSFPGAGCLQAQLFAAVHRVAGDAAAAAAAPELSLIPAVLQPGMPQLG